MRNTLEERKKKEDQEAKVARNWGSTVAQAYAGFLGVDAVEDALVSDLTLGG